MTITAKFGSTCPACGGRIHAGESVTWTPGSKAAHASCPTVAQPAATTQQPHSTSPLQRHNVNRRGAACAACGKYVPAGTGTLVHNDEEAETEWSVYHLDPAECHAERERIALAAEHAALDQAALAAERDALAELASATGLVEKTLVMDIAELSIDQEPIVRSAHFVALRRRWCGEVDGFVISRTVRAR